MLHTPEFLAARHAAMLAATAGYAGVDETDPKNPSGHDYGIRVSSKLTSDYRKRLRSGSVKNPITKNYELRTTNYELFSKNQEPRTKNQELSSYKLSYAPNT